ncbi:MAG: leucine-rich repeat domain-containing protein [Lachnospiraceae bacterium]|nr:leucine-rich repeat domain-containing protein [Lachnospiraceae bacterium]
MNRKISKTLSVLLLLTAIVVSQVPVPDAQASVASSDFQVEGKKLLKYTGTADAVSVPDGIKVIGEEAFAGNDNLVKVTIAGDVESVGYRAFAGCDNLRTITVGDSVSTIGTAAFANNRELTNVTLGAGVKDFGMGVFAGCSRLSDLSIAEDNGFLYFSGGVLYDDEETVVYALMPAYEKEAYTLPSTVKEITGYAFWGNPYLQRVVLGSGFYEIPAYAFSNCINLREVEIPLPVHSIGSKAFEDCVNLQRVVLPDSMNHISDSAFDGCPNVKFSATPGTYSAEFAAALNRSDVEEVEYEDVQDSRVINADEVTGAQKPEASPEADKESEPATTPAQEENTDLVPEPTMGAETESINNMTLLGQSSIVAGRAVIFIDNRQSNVLSGNQPANGNQDAGRVDLSQLSAGEDGNLAAGQEANVENLLADGAQKGKDFPKYTVVGGNRIAGQAFYQDINLSEYDIEEGITQIGEFAFARSGLRSVDIPEGVTSIGYGAFYHCDSLKEVTIPSTVTEIEPYAFEKTPWIQTDASSPYKIVGDGILLAYGGSDSVVNIPDGVKQIGPQVFKDHMGITAVNIPDSVEVICEEAFMGCRNLKTVNGGGNLVKVSDRAFMDCPLSFVTIPASMKEIGLGAYALNGGTDTVVFNGSTLPKLTVGISASRLANGKYRTYAFGTIKTAVIPDQAQGLEGTVLEAGIYGFNGVICNESGAQVADNSEGVAAMADSGIALQINSQVISDGANTQASLAGDEGAYVLRIVDSPEAGEKITAAYGELYGGREPSHLSAYDISLYDASGTVPITRLGKQEITVQVPLPSGISADAMHVVTLDQDGQLEAVEHRVTALDDGDYLQFTTSHFSPFGIYNYTGINGQAYVTDGKAVITSLAGNKDNTPDTGDPIHPKWFLTAGLLAGAVALFFYKGKPKKLIK